MKMRTMVRQRICLTISLLIGSALFPGCDSDLYQDIYGYDTPKIYYEGRIYIYNQTGHNIFINSQYVSVGEHISYYYRHERHEGYSLPVLAFMEEYDATGNLIWGYYQKRSISVDKDDFNLNLTPEINDYKPSDISKYPVILKNMTVTNKTGYKLCISEGNTYNNSFLTLEDGQVGTINMPQLITDNKSFYFFVINNNSYGSPLRMTFSRSFLRNNTSFDIPPELLAKGVIIY